MNGILRSVLYAMDRNDDIINAKPDLPNWEFLLLNANEVTGRPQPCGFDPSAVREQFGWLCLLKAVVVGLRPAEIFRGLRGVPMIIMPTRFNVLYM